MKKNNIIYGIAKGNRAEISGAELGVWNIYYNLQKLDLPMDEIFFIDDSSCKNNNLHIDANFFKSIYSKLQQIKNISKHLFITGDHFNAYPIWRYFATKHNSNFGLIWLDAHLDSHNEKTSQSKNMHGTTISHLLNDPNNTISIKGNAILPKNICFIGTRSYENEELYLMEQLGVKIFYMKDINPTNRASIFNKAIEHVTKNNQQFGLSFDIDVLDPTLFPCTGCYVENGFELNHIKPYIHKIINHKNFEALEITEYNPLLGSNAQQIRTLNMILSIIKHYLK